MEGRKERKEKNKQKGKFRAENHLPISNYLKLLPRFSQREDRRHEKREIQKVEKYMNYGCNCEQHFKFTKSFANTINIKFF